MVPHGKPSLPSIATCGIQYALAVVLLAIPHVTDHPWMFYSYYGVGLIAVPALLRAVSGRALPPYQRLCFSLGLALHPYSMFLELYPQIWWWDVLAHFVSGSLLAAGLYLVLRGVGGAVGTRATAGGLIHAGAFLGVLSGAVAWEVYEVFAPWLTVYGQMDIAKDIVVGLTAWAAVAGLQPRLFGPIPRGIADWLERFLPGRGGLGTGDTPDRADRPMTDGGTTRE